MSLSNFPPDDAGPRQIRQYLTNHLMTKHDTTTEFAEQIASLWQIGRGVDFRQTSINIHSFSKIFGETVSPALQRSVHDECWNQWRASQLGTLSLWLMIISLITAALVFVRTARQPSMQWDDVLRRTCWPLGPPVLLCGALEYGYSLLYPVYCFTMGSIATLCGLTLWAFRFYDEKERKESKDKK
ncbi:uncharacterized protein N7484_004202 [Penicillium longicatenatum]|uniref:uncharacterized protein n=1 Tax=Penicillium longicatenatum TaxID=1561947 RepID=UPI002548366A|nr:uncharacterized protein N7484_004202 [Penicillium longicatenatum]KAJ5650479.1 hypothetical protein N7484_004202 [Penicillium longicatenatum]